MKNEIIQKQNYQKQIADATDTLQALDRQMEEIRVEEKYKNIQLEELQAAFDNLARTQGSALLQNPLKDVATNSDPIPAPKDSPAPPNSLLSPQFGTGVDVAKRDAVKEVSLVDILLFFRGIYCLLGILTCLELVQNICMGKG